MHREQENGSNDDRVQEYQLYRAEGNDWVGSGSSIPADRVDSASDMTRLDSCGIVNGDQVHARTML